jgi:hypothetical protein
LTASEIYLGGENWQIAFPGRWGYKAQQIDAPGRQDFGPLALERAYFRPFFSWENGYG